MFPVTSIVPASYAQSLNHWCIKIDPQSNQYREVSPQKLKQYNAKFYL